MENSFTKKSKKLSDQDLVERIYYPENFVPNAVEAALHEIKLRELENIDFSTVEKFLAGLKEQKQKEDEYWKELKQKEKQTAKIDSHKIQERQFANFGFRFIAIILDIIISTVIAIVVIFFANPLIKIVGILGEEAVIHVNNGIILLTWWLYFSISDATDSQATYGKKILKIKVVKIDGSKLDFLTSTFRFLLKIVSGLILGIGFLIAIFSSTNQTLHDRIIKTYVIKRS